MDDTNVVETTKPAHSEVPLTFEDAIRLTAPGTALRHALDMIIAGRLGALICVGDSEAVLAAGNDGFPLNISYTANRLFELSKMDGAVVIDSTDLTIDEVLAAVLEHLPADYKA